MSGCTLNGFTSLKTHHCVTGSMLHIYHFNKHPVSEEALLGLGGGVGFVYWHMKGTDPFMGGRGKGRPGQGFERCAGERTGVAIDEFVTSSVAKAAKSLTILLASGQPVMVQVDMGFLPYFDFGGYDFHFGAHLVVICGYNETSGTVMVADRDEGLHEISLEDLRKARNSKYKPFSPKNRWFTFDFSKKRFPAKDDFVAAIREQTKQMLTPPIKNLGVAGIYKSALTIPAWMDSADAEAVRRGLFNFYIFIDAKGGSGGGLFRYMFGRFLHEAAETAGLDPLYGSVEEFKEIGDRWQKLAKAFHEGSEEGDSRGLRSRIQDNLTGIAESELKAWEELEKSLGT